MSNPVLTISDFDYNLPNELIALHPTQKRDESRLLVVENNQFHNLKFNNIINFLNKGDLLVLNNSRVIKARLLGHKVTGGKIEILIERIVNNNELIAHIRSNKTINLDLEIILPNNLSVTVTQKLDGLFKLRINQVIDIYAYLENHGQIPLPPYIERETENTDSERYQTIYAKDLGSVAAPTAGLHFTQDLLKQITDKGINITYVTLHVGSGTFKPVLVDDISQHKMHSEYYSIDESSLDLILNTQKNGGKIIAGGTTSLRTLETIAKNNFKKLSGETDIFITPGFEFKLVDKLITNFHLPKSTLLMLVSAFIGLETTKSIYNYAIKECYRFFSYGDAMLLTRKDEII